MVEDIQHVSADHLSDYLRGDLDPSIEVDVEEHIGSCLVCARRLREEAQLEVLLFEAHEGVAVAASAPSRRALWQRVAATVANSAAAAAALLLVITPGQPLHSTGGHRVSPGGSASATAASAFVNDALCFPSSVPAPADEDCEEPIPGMVAMATDPDDYLSPFDGEPAGERGAAVCSVEDLACEPG